MIAETPPSVQSPPKKRSLWRLSILGSLLVLSAATHYLEINARKSAEKFFVGVPINLLEYSSAEQRSVANAAALGLMALPQGPLPTTATFGNERCFRDTPHVGAPREEMRL